LLKIATIAEKKTLYAMELISAAKKKAPQKTACGASFYHIQS
jgi:hypothetical protein